MGPCSLRIACSYLADTSCFECAVFPIFSVQYTFGPKPVFSFENLLIR